MAQKEKTGPKAASAAGKVLSNPKSTKAEKSAAASALTQAPNKKKINISSHRRLLIRMTARDGIVISPHR